MRNLKYFLIKINLSQYLDLFRTIPSSVLLRAFHRQVNISVSEETLLFLMDLTTNK